MDVFNARWFSRIVGFSLERIEIHFVSGGEDNRVPLVPSNRKPGKCKQRLLRGKNVPVVVPQPNIMWRRRCVV